MVSILKSVDELRTKVYEAGDKLIVLDFYATWCGPCKEMENDLHAIAKRYKEHAVIIKINVEKFNDLADYYKVRCMPTFIFLKNKRRLASFTGADSNMLSQNIDSLIS